jgi:hypothetical protein
MAHTGFFEVAVGLTKGEVQWRQLEEEVILENIKLTILDLELRNFNY